MIRFYQCFHLNRSYIYNNIPTEVSLNLAIFKAVIKQGYVTGENRIKSYPLREKPRNKKHIPIMTLPDKS